MLSIIVALGSLWISQQRFSDKFSDYSSQKDRGAIRYTPNFQILKAAQADPTKGLDMAAMQGDIEKSEYYIRYQETAGKLQSPNRAQNMRFGYDAQGFEAEPRKDSLAQWHVSMEMKGIYRGSALKLSPSENTEKQLNGNHLLYQHPGFAVEYQNTTEGMRQNFIVEKRPEGQGKLSVKLHIQSSGLTLACHNNELSGSQHGITHYRYSDLKVWDANHSTIPANMTMKGEELILSVNDAGAQYPLTP